MNDPAQRSSNPNDQLAQEVVDSLIKKYLLKKPRLSEALKKIQSGKARQSDWRMWAEDSLPKDEPSDAPAEGI